MRKPIVFSALFLLLFFSNSGCGDGSNPADPFVERQLPQEVQDHAASVVDATNRFAVDLYQELRSKNEGNLFFSPFSVSTALTMTYAGAEGVTEEEMGDVLHVSGLGENVHESMGALIASLDRGSDLGAYRLNVANRLWGEEAFDFLDEFLDVCNEEYEAGLETVSFSTDPDGSRQTINEWVEQKTERKNEDLLPPGSVTDLTRLVLTNAIYFKGDWADRFDEGDTREAPFYLTDGGSASVPLMFQEIECGHAAGDGFSFLELAYEGKDLSMLILLPDETDGLPALEDRLTYDNLEAWRSSLVDREVRVHLPRFEVTEEYTLSQNLSDMGMPSAFEPPGGDPSDGADFSGMTGRRDLFIQGAYHKAYVKVNEEGTEAAAATGVVTGVTSVPDYPVFRADHPFLFLIRDNVTGAILFMGALEDPSV